MKFIKIFFLIIFFLIINLNYANSENKVAFIDLDRVLKKTNAGKIILEEIKNINDLNVKELHNKEIELRNIEEEIKMKKNILSKEEFDSQVPESMSDLISLPGVGRKTANVVRSVALGLPGLPVDTHVGRLSRRLAITEENDPVKIELVLNPMLPAQERGEFSLRVILHGRRVCFARKPNCDECILNYFCPSAFTF